MIGAVLVLIGLPIVLLLIVFVSFYAVFTSRIGPVLPPVPSFLSARSGSTCCTSLRATTVSSLPLFLLPLNLKPSADADAAITQTAMISRIY